MIGEIGDRGTNPRALHGEIWKGLISYLESGFNLVGFPKNHFQVTLGPRLVHPGWSVISWDLGNCYPWTMTMGSSDILFRKDEFFQKNNCNLFQGIITLWKIFIIWQWQGSNIFLRWHSLHFCEYARCASPVNVLLWMSFHRNCREFEAQTGGPILCGS